MATVTAQLFAQQVGAQRAVLVGVGLLPLGAVLVVLAVAGSSLPLFLTAAW